MPANILLDPSARPVIGHRGAAAHAPENTMESFAAAMAAGAEALETDVQLTADGEVVVLHDESIDRTTDGSGAIGALRLAAVRDADAGARFTPDGGLTFPWRGRGVRISPLSDVLEAFPDVPFLIDAKTRAVAEPLRAVLERHAARDRVIVGSFDARNLSPFRDGGWSLGATRRDVVRLLARVRLGTRPRHLGYSVLSVPPRTRRFALPIARFVAAVRPFGCTVHVWTINDPAEARALWAIGANGIVSDDPRIIRSARDLEDARAPSGA